MGSVLQQRVTDRSRQEIFFSNFEDRRVVGRLKGLLKEQFSEFSKVLNIFWKTLPTWTFHTRFSSWHVTRTFHGSFVLTSICKVWEWWCFETGSIRCGTSKYSGCLSQFPTALSVGFIINIFTSENCFLFKRGQASFTSNSGSKLLSGSFVSI